MTQYDSRDPSDRTADAIALAVSLLLHVGRYDEAAIVLALAPERDRVGARLRDAECYALGIEPRWREGG